MFWWFSHCFIIFWSLLFPFHYKQFRDTGRIKYAHAVIIISGLVLPAVLMATTVIVSLTVGEFILLGLPPLACLPTDKNATFYPIILPVSILMAFGVSLLVMVFYRLIQVRVVIIILIYIYNIYESIFSVTYYRYSRPKATPKLPR